MMLISIRRGTVPSPSVQPRRVPNAKTRPITRLIDIGNPPRVKSQNGSKRKVPPAGSALLFAECGVLGGARATHSHARSRKCNGERSLPDAAEKA